MGIINNPRKIEAMSFKIINALLKGIRFSKHHKDVVRRVIHTTVDVNYAQDLLFSHSAIEAGISAIRQGRNIVVDSSMVKAGINKNIAAWFHNKIICHINDKDVIRKASDLNLTRAIIAMRSSQQTMHGGIVAIGNAPTALFEICQMVKSGKTGPVLIIGVPVGFVGAVESKKMLRSLEIPYITNKSRKGGSAVAAAIVNALLIIARKSVLFFIIGLIIADNAFAMHISEGILPMQWAGLWYLIALPFLAKGIMDIKNKTKNNSSLKPLLGLMGAVVFVISCMPVPVPTAGTCSHPAGTGISAVLVGPILSIFITSTALLIQALFLAHGGITTWGADIVSMGIAGSFAGYCAFKLLLKVKAPLFLCGFMAGLLADWATYLMTSFELALGLCGNKPLFPLFITVLIAFIPTQLPLGILEGFLTGGMIIFVAKRRPDILTSLGVVKKVIPCLALFVSIFWSWYYVPFVYAEGKWRGVDETIVEKVAQEYGRHARQPFINTDQGDLLLFVFLLSGIFGGFVIGYYWRKFFIEKEDLKHAQRIIQ